MNELVLLPMYGKATSRNS